MSDVCDPAAPLVVKIEPRRAPGVHDARGDALAGERQTRSSSDERGVLPAVSNDRELVGAFEAHEADLCRSEQLPHLYDDGVEDMGRSSALSATRVATRRSTTYSSARRRISPRVSV